MDLRIDLMPEQGPAVTQNAMAFLAWWSPAHSMALDRLMQDLETWAREHELPFVDFRKILDEQRHLMVSWVHLGPEANAMMAEALAAEILPRACSERATMTD